MHKAIVSHEERLFCEYTIEKLKETYEFDRRSNAQLYYIVQTKLVIVIASFAPVDDNQKMEEKNRKSSKLAIKCEIQ